jgi:hypothetical protein
MALSCRPVSQQLLARSRLCTRPSSLGSAISLLLSSFRSVGAAMAASISSVEMPPFLAALTEYSISSADAKPRCRAITRR